MIFFQFYFEGQFPKFIQNTFSQVCLLFYLLKSKCDGDMYFENQFVEQKVLFGYNVNKS